LVNARDEASHNRFKRLIRRNLVRRSTTCTAGTFVSPSNATTPSNSSHSGVGGASSLPFVGPTATTAAIPPKGTPTVAGGASQSQTPPSSPAVSPSPSPASTPAGGKKGLGIVNATDATPFGNTVSWYYNWATTPVLPRSNIEFVPMLWSGADVTTWAADAAAAIAANSTHVLGFNEPDLAAQANLSPSKAAQLWQANMEPLKAAHPSLKLVSPAVTNGGAPLGIAWLVDFIEACTGCHIDALALHIYDSASNIAYFQGYLTDAIKNPSFGGRPIWVTEFMGSGTMAEQATFLGTMVPWMDDQPGIERYAAFGVTTGDSFASGGTLTTLGTAYQEA